MEFILEIIVVVFLVAITIAVWALLIGAFYNGIKQAKNESKGKSEQVVINIVLTDKESKS